MRTGRDNRKPWEAVINRYDRVAVDALLFIPWRELSVRHYERKGLLLGGRWPGCSPLNQLCGKMLADRGVQMTDVDRAAQMFRDGCACSQAILEVYGTPLGLSREQAMRLGAGFAGGMRLGETCGAVTGAFMVLGLRHSATDCNKAAGRAEVYTRVADFADRFKKRNGSFTCRDLLGCDISTAEGLKQAQAQNLFKTTCVKAVEDAAEILEEMESGSQARTERDSQ